MYVHIYVYSRVVSKSKEKENEERGNSERGVRGGRRKRDFTKSMKIIRNITEKVINTISKIPVMFIILSPL